MAESATGRKESAQRKLAEEMRYKPSAGAALEAHVDSSQVMADARRWVEVEATKVEGAAP